MSRVAGFVQRARGRSRARPYRRAMNPFSESAFQARAEGPSFLARVGIAFVVLTAGIGVALLMAAA